MGLRVHKILGYGVKPLSHGHGKKLDDEATWERAEEIGPEKFLGWMQKHKDEIRKIAGIDENRFDLDMAIMRGSPKKGPFGGEWTLTDSWFYQREFGYKDVVVFVPPCHFDWARYDDLIDYTEECVEHECERRLKVLNRAIYPYLKEKPPCTIAAVLLWLGIPEVWPDLKEMLYVYWS